MKRNGWRRQWREGCGNDETTSDDGSRNADFTHGIIWRVRDRSKEEGASLHVKYRGCGRCESWNVNKKRGIKLGVCAFTVVYMTL
ncbi:hypothetical protein YC2023_088992 [Brassica napus]